MRYQKNTIFISGGVSLILLIFLTLYLHIWILDIETDIPCVSIPQTSAQPIIYFGVVSRYSPRQIIYQPFMEYLSDHTAYQFELRLNHNYVETVQQLVRGKVDFASLGNYVYVKANADYGIRGIAKPYDANDETYFKEVIVIPEDSDIQSISDLARRSFAFASSASFSFWMTQYISTNTCYL